MTGINTELHLKMNEAPNYCAPHYVQLYVTDSNEKILGCEVQIYTPNNDPINEKPNFCAWTNNDGRVNFHLTQDVTYKIVTITADGKKYTTTLTPNLDQYTIKISANDISSIPEIQTIVSSNCTYKQMNNTETYVNASSSNSSLKSSNLTFLLGIMGCGAIIAIIGYLIQNKK